LNRLAGILLILVLIAITFASVLGYAFETKAPATVTSVKVVPGSASGKVQLVTITEEIIGVVTPQTATLTIEVSPASPNCTIGIPTFNPPIIEYNTTEFLLPFDNENSASVHPNSTFSVVSTVTTFSQMPNAQTAYTTVAESGNIEVNTTITSVNSTITTSACPVYA